MKSVVKKCLWIFGCLLATSNGPAASKFAVTVTGISIPFFNDAGKLTHRLLAKHGVTSGNLQELTDVEVHYFSAADPKVIVQKIEAEDATWDDRKETLVGRGGIVVATVETRLTGRGYDFALGTGLLHIHREFVMSNPEVVLTSDRATVELIVERKGENVKVRDVKRCEAHGNLRVVVAPTATKKYEFKELSSDLAIYDGATQTITLPNTTRTLQPDGGTGKFETVNFTLKKDRSDF